MRTSCGGVIRQCGFWFSVAKGGHAPITPHEIMYLSVLAFLPQACVICGDLVLMKSVYLMHTSEISVRSTGEPLGFLFSTCLHSAQVKFVMT